MNIKHILVSLVTGIFSLSINNETESVMEKTGFGFYDLVYPTSSAPVYKMATLSSAKSLLEYASAAYCPRNTLLNWSCNNCKKNTIGSSEIFYFSDLSGVATGYLAVNQHTKQIILSFRGTHQILNWVYNFDIFTTNVGLTGQYSGALIHSGFNDMANALFAQAQAALEQTIQRNPGFTVVFTGHSSGGATAGILAFRFGQNQILPWERINIITFGQPRLGNLIFAQFLNSRPWSYTRVTSYSDIVPRLPATTLGYAHNQYNMHINKNGEIAQCSIYKEDPNCTADYTIPSWAAHDTFWGVPINQYCKKI